MRAGSNLSAQKPAPSKYEDWIEFARTASHGWHEEETKYPYDHPHYDNAWGHFTQMVWRNTSRIGCAIGYCDPGKVDWPGRFYCCKCHFTVKRLDYSLGQTTTLWAITLRPVSSRRRSGVLFAVSLLLVRLSNVRISVTIGLASKSYFLQPSDRSPRPPHARYRITSPDLI